MTNEAVDSLFEAWNIRVQSGSGISLIETRALARLAVNNNILADLRSCNLVEGCVPIFDLDEFTADNRSSSSGMLQGFVSQTQAPLLGRWTFGHPDRRTGGKVAQGPPRTKIGCAFFRDTPNMAGFLGVSV